MDIKKTLNIVADSTDLSFDEMRDVMNIIMSGEATPSQIGAFLMALRVKGETVEEIAGAVSILREKMTPVAAPANAIDIVGTGGDGVGTYNISTASSIVVASAGCPVAKHGNKALSSKSGSSEALLALGVELDLPAAGIAACIERAGIGFHVCAKSPRRDAVCRPVSTRNGRAHHFQPIGTSIKPSWREALFARRVRQAMGAPCR